MFSNKKICILRKEFAKYVHFDLLYVLGYSGYFDMHIEKLYRINTHFFFDIPQKTGITVRRGGGLRTLRTGLQLIFNLIDAFPVHIYIYM